MFWAQIVGHDDDEEIEEEERNGERGKSRWTLYFRDSIKILRARYNQILLTPLILSHPLDTQEVEK